MRTLCAWYLQIAELETQIRSPDKRISSAEKHQSQASDSRFSTVDKQRNSSTRVSEMQEDIRELRHERRRASPQRKAEIDKTINQYLGKIKRRTNFHQPALQLRSSVASTAEYFAGSSVKRLADAKADAKKSLAACRAKIEGLENKVTTTYNTLLARRTACSEAVADYKRAYNIR